MSNALTSVWSCLSLMIASLPLFVFLSPANSLNATDKLHHFLFVSGTFRLLVLLSDCLMQWTCDLNSFLLICTVNLNI